AFVLVVSLILFGVNASHADVVYTYTGNTFNPNLIADDVIVAVPGSYDPTMRVTGTITLANALAPNLPLQDITASLLDYSFNDGRNTLDKANSQGVFQIETDATGAILNWDIELSHVKAVPQQPVLLETIAVLFITPDIVLLSTKNTAQSR